MIKDPFSIKLPKIKQPKFDLFGKASSREPLPADKKRKVRERAKNTCEYRGCKHKENLQFHHKNMKNSDSRLSNIELLCPNHHAKRHSQKGRKVLGHDFITGEKITRLIKKPTKKKSTKKKTSKKKRKKKSPYDIPEIKIPKIKI